MREMKKETKHLELDSNPYKPKEARPEYTWKYHCFKFYRFLSMLNSHRDLIITELAVLSKETPIRPEVDQRQALIRAILFELKGVEQRLSDQDYRVGQVYYWFYEDLVEIGLAMLSLSVPLEELCKLMGVAEATQCDLVRNFVGNAGQLEGLELTISTAKKQRPDEYYRIRKEVKQALTQTEQHQGTPEVLDALRLARTAIGRDYGNLGIQIADESILGSNVVKLEGGKQHRYRKLQRRYGKEILAVMVVDLLLKYHIHSVVSTSCRFLNSLLCSPEFPLESNGESRKSIGADRLRKLYKKETGKTILEQKRK